MLNLIFSLDILLFSNIIKYFRYGFNSFLYSFKLKPRDSYIKLPLNIFFGFLNFVRFFCLGVATSASSFLKSFDDVSKYYLGLNKKLTIKNVYTDDYYMKKFCVHNVLTDDSKLNGFMSTNQYYLASKFSEYGKNKIFL